MKLSRKTLPMEGVLINGSSYSRLDSGTMLSGQFIANDGDRITVDTTTGSSSIKLPENPRIGDHITIVDKGLNLSVNSLTIVSNPMPIDSGDPAIDLIVDKDDIHIELICVGGTTGWKYTEVLSGNRLKTVNGQSLIGVGNIKIESWGDLVTSGEFVSQNGNVITYNYKGSQIYRFVPSPYIASGDIFYSDAGMTIPIATRG